MIATQSDSDGNTYSIWQQNQMNSCAVASMWMARNLVRQQTMMESEWELAQRFYRAAVNDMFAPLGVDPNGPMCLNPGSFPSDRSSMASTLANTGFKIDHIVRALENDGIIVDVQRRQPNAPPLTMNPRLLGPTTPAIIGVYWNGGGGHAIVVPRMTAAGRVVYLDPWDGNLIEQANSGTYNARYGGQGQIGVIFYLMPDRMCRMP